MRKSEYFTSPNSPMHGHVITKEGISPDPIKSHAVLDHPISLSELSGFLGLVNQLGKFSARLADLS